jgi:hypothetical protein
LKIAGKEVEIKQEASLASIVAIIGIIATMFSIFATFGYIAMQFQQLKDDIVSVKRDQIQIVAENDKKAAMIAQQLKDAKDKRDQTEDVIRDELNMLSNHVENLTKYLTGKQHSEVETTLPKIASLRESPYWQMPPAHVEELDR